jgi:hypothetical protein
MPRCLADVKCYEFGLQTSGIRAVAYEVVVYARKTNNC